MIRDNSKDEVEIRWGFYPSGAIMWESPYVDGEKHGIVKGYYESGALRYEIPYVNGAKHGLVKGYHESGALRYETPYMNGRKHGIEKLYNKDRSDIECLLLYKKGQRVTSIKSNI